MTLGEILYGIASRALAPFVPFILRRRVAARKELPARLHERRARNLPERPSGKLIWMHGASVGETQILLGLARRMAVAGEDLHFLFTSQTLTSAQLVFSRNLPKSLHQMAPVDTPAIARRFLTHWTPDLAIFAEGEIWPNLISSASDQGVPLALVNARMTEKSRSAWSRWPGFARRVFGSFDLILPADTATATALEHLSGKSVAPSSNLKRGLPPPGADGAEIAALRSNFLDGRKCILAASTHPREEVLFVDAAARLGIGHGLVIAPRHPERGGELARELSALGLNVAQRSIGESPTSETQVYLADTMGEMGLWFELADAIFLGGASVPGIGGHNPIEPLQLGKTVVTGPHGFNFATLFEELEAKGLLELTEDTASLSAALASQLEKGNAADKAALGDFLANADAPIRSAAGELIALMAPRGA